MVLHQLLYGLSSVDLLRKARCLLYMSTVTFNVNVRGVGDLEFTYFGIPGEIGVLFVIQEGEKLSYELFLAFRGKIASRRRVRRAQTQQYSPANHNRATMQCWNFQRETLEFLPCLPRHIPASNPNHISRMLTADG